MSVTLPVQPLAVGAFAAFGTVIELPAREVDASGPGWQWWAENAYLPAEDRAYGVGYLDLQPAERRFDWAERHMRSVEMIVPIEGSCLVYVGPPEYPESPDRLPALEAFKVFDVRQGQGVILHKGVWHGAPLATGGAAKVVVLLLQDTARTDLALVRFPDTPVSIGGS